MSLRRLADVLFFATFFSVTFEKVHWNIAGTVGIADVLTILFLATFALQGRTRWPRTCAILLAFLATFLVLYLLAFFNLQTVDALHQFSKGMVKFVLHFLFMICAVAYLVQRGERFYWRTIGWFAVGMVANAAYGVLQLLAARAGHNLDASVLSPLTGGASAINIYGRVSGAVVYRPNALTGDPNHLGIMLSVPLLVLTPLYLRMEKGHRLRWPLGLTLAFLLLVFVSTLSRSGALGLGVGLLVLALPYRRFALSRALLVPLAGVAAVLLYIVSSRRSFISTIIHSRLQTSGTSGTSAHFAVYSFIPQIVHSHPLLGLGLNTFSVYYEFVTGKSNWGPHSYWVALVVETGLLGLLLYVVFLRYVYVRLRAARILGRLRADRRVLPLAWGFTAAITGTLASNFFYLTMQFYYFFGVVALALALPVVFARRAT